MTTKTRTRKGGISRKEFDRAFAKGMAEGMGAGAGLARAHSASTARRRARTEAEIRSWSDGSAIIDRLCRIRSAPPVGEPVFLPALDMAATRAVISNVADQNRSDGIDAVLAPSRGRRVAPLLQQVPTTTDRSHVAEETSRTEAAAPAAYGNLLPEAAIAFTADAPEPKRVGTWIPVMVSTFEDRGLTEQVVRTLFTQELPRELDHQLLNGDGTGENFTGFYDAASGIASVARGADTRLDVLITVAGAIRGADHTGPLNVVINPTDMTALLLEKDGNGEPVFDLALLREAGIEGFVQSSLAPAGSPLVGDFQAGAHLFPRKPISTSVSRDHDDFFLKGKVAVASEFRANMKVVRPSALRIVTGF